MAPMSREGGIGDGKGRKVAFQDEAHEASFRERSRLTARGGPFAAVCGARTRTGSACQKPPIREGSGSPACEVITPIWGLLRLSAKSYAKKYFSLTLAPFAEFTFRHELRCTTSLSESLFYIRFTNLRL